MKMLSANRCLFIATLSLVTATVPLLSIAQEEVTNDAQAVQPQVAQRRFVSDKLVLNVYAEPDQSSARVATIQTGDAVDELERTDNLVRVRLEDGREGWVGANFLVSDAPAAVRLRELEREQKAATRGSDKESAEEIARLKKANAALQTQVKELQASAKALVATPAEEPAQIIAASAAEVVRPDPELAGVAPSGGSSWPAWLVAVVLTGALGFASGYQTLASRLRRRFGALKIY
jgi:SH3-like domain-containing protein